jgi:hypothetical protein
MSLNQWANAEFFDAALAALERVGPLPAFAAIVAIPLYLALHHWSQTHVVPVVAMLLMGGAVMGLLPAAVAQIAWVVILFAGSLALFAVLWMVIR